MSNLTPDKIISLYHSNELDVITTIGLLASIIESNDNTKLRIESISHLSKLISKNHFDEKIFKIFESCIITDEDFLVRISAIKSLTQAFPEKCLMPLEWAIKNEKSIRVLHIIISLIKRGKIKKISILNTALSERIGVVSEEVGFFCELLTFEAKKLEESNEDTNFNSLFYKANTIEDFKDKLKYVEYGSYVYTIDSDRVIAFSFTPISHPLKVIPKSLKTLSKLSWLNLSGNNLEIIPDWLGNFTDIIYLNLSFNNALKILPDSIFELSKRNFSQRYVNEGVMFCEASVLGLFEILIGCRLENFKIRKDYNFYDLGDNGFVNKLFLVNLPFIPEQIGLLEHLEQLSISDSSVKILPQCVGNLVNLRMLGISETDIKTIPESLENLTSLKNLYLSKNQLQELSDTIIKLSSLEYLSLNDNNIQKIPDSIGNLRNLISLNLSKNKFNTLPKSIENLDSLRYLHISDMKIKKLPITLINLKSIEFLEVDSFSEYPKQLSPSCLSEIMEKHKELRYRKEFIDEGVIQEEVAALARIHYLVGFDFKEFKFKSENTEDNYEPEGYYEINNQGNVIKLHISVWDDEDFPEQLRKFKNLEELYFNSTEFKKLPDWIGDFRHLSELGITSSAGIENIPSSIGNLKTLKVLNLIDNSIRELPLEIGNLIQLKKLNLSCNKITNLPESMASLRALESLNLSHNKLTNLPDFLPCLLSLKDLDISENLIKEIPEIVQNIENFKI